MFASVGVSCRAGRMICNATEVVQVERAKTGVHCLSLLNREELCDILQRLVKYPSLDNCH